MIYNRPYETVTSDSIVDAIVSSGSPADVLVSFTYAGLRVYVHSPDTVYVQPTSGARAEFVNRMSSFE